MDEFRANDVISYSANEGYREPGKPWFRTATFKGGGDAASAARAVLETGEFDYAWNLQVEPEVLESMSAGGKGEVLAAYGTLVERLMVNHTNDDPSLGPERRSLYLDGANPHPFLADPAVRRALSMAIDRQVLVAAGYGAGGKPTCNVVPAPPIYASTANDECQTPNVPEANRLLDEAGWMRGEDGVRAKDGVRLSILFQTSTNSVRQGTQALIKQMWGAIGVETELRNIDGGVFFGGDPASRTPFRSSTPTFRCTPTTSTARIRKSTWPVGCATKRRARTISGLAATFRAPAWRSTTRWWGNWRARGARRTRRHRQAPERHPRAQPVHDSLDLARASFGAVDVFAGRAHQRVDSELWNVADWHR